MGKDCFCGCGQKVGRQLKTVNKRGAEIRFLGGELESHTLPVQEAYVLMSERGGDPEELRGAREAVAITRETIADLQAIQAQTAAAVHADDPTEVSAEKLGALKDNLAAQNANTRKLQFTVGLKYPDIPGLGPEGIVEFIERQDR